ncbi:MAG: hypothetical protein ABIP07_00375 [Sphingomicrobium sp.]
MKRIALTLVPLALAACVTPISESTTTGTPTAGFGQTANVGPLRVRPVKLIEDSRCPSDVQCVWAGRITVQAEIDGGAGAEVAPLTLGSPLDLGGISVTLVAAEPQKLAGKTIDRGDYRFTFAFANNR